MSESRGSVTHTGFDPEFVLKVLTDSLVAHRLFGYIEGMSLFGMCQLGFLVHKVLPSLTIDDLRGDEMKLSKSAEYIAIFLITARDERKEFMDRAQALIDSGEMTREEIPKVLDEICKIKGDAGEIARRVRDQLKQEGWSP